MATYTIELYRLVEMGTDLGLSEYPIFDEEYRVGLNKKIIDHFWNREIGHESVDQFRFNLKRRMNEVMPFYNQLYDSAKLVFNPLYSQDITNTSERVSEQVANAESSSDSTSNGTSDSNAVVSNFPQTALAGNADYANNGTFGKSNSNTSANTSDNSSSNSTNTDSVTSTSQGYTGSPSALLSEYRSTFLNIDMLVINELEDLFMLVWNNSDEYTTRKGWF